MLLPGAILEDRVDQQTTAGAAQYPSESCVANDFRLIERDDWVRGNENRVGLFMHSFSDAVVGKEMDALGFGIGSASDGFRVLG